jgi:hypothetical protein
VSVCGSADLEEIQRSFLGLCNVLFFPLILLEYIYLQGDSLQQSQIGLHCTFIRLPHHLPFNPLPAPLKTITKGFIVLFPISM